MDDTYIHCFERLIAARTGLQLRPRERDALVVTLEARMAALRLLQVDKYYQLLLAGNLEAECEWGQLVARLTNNESYFFRDKGQMALLRERILPELIARNQARRTLRIWSAGCSTGEEPYSLAMLVDELLPRRCDPSGAQWEIVILGTDIDERALQKARRGIYSRWSFRTMEPARQQSYFHRQESGWQITEASRSLVIFGLCNLVRDVFPSTAAGILEMDLILCRNVFIYFAPEAVSAVLPKFAHTLREGGYLMTGHTETQGQTVAPLKARIFPYSVVYQRVRKPTVNIETPVGGSPGSASTTVDRAPTPIYSQPPVLAAISRAPAAIELVAEASATAQAATVEHALAQAEVYYTAGDYPEVIRTLQLSLEPVRDRALVLRARAHANLGHYEEATDCCEFLIKESPFASEPYEILASIAQEQMRYDEAKGLLKKALYLAPESPQAYLELGAIYLHEGDKPRARKFHYAALGLLQQLPPDGAVGSSGGPAVQEWIRHLNQLLAEGE